MRPGKILVVDDDPEVRMATRDFLSSKGYEVALAEGGREALRMIDASPPDVVLLDVAMPDMDGMEALKLMVATHPTMPVIMVTANADIEITSTVLQLGAADYVPKPFDLDYLDQAISIQLAARGIQDASCVGPGKSNLPFELQRKAGDCSRVTAGPIDRI